LSNSRDTYGILINFVPHSIYQKLNIILEQKYVERKVILTDLPPLIEFTFEMKALSSEQRQIAAIHAGKLTRWFQLETERKIPRGIAKTVLAKDSAVMLAQLVRANKSYVEALPRLKGFLRSFSDESMQIAAMKIILSSREESISIPKRHDFEEDNPDGDEEEDAELALVRAAGEAAENGADEH